MRYTISCNANDGWHVIEDSVEGRRNQTGLFPNLPAEFGRYRVEKRWEKAAWVPFTWRLILN
ncbi:MAG: hypothetical protein U0936_02255 [Planctomycetaceae bacterium]